MRSVVALGVLAITAATAGTAVADAPEPGMDYVLVPPQPKVRRAGTAHVLYLNRCASGCPLRLDVDDSKVDGSTIPESAGPLTPFMFGDAAWDTVVACMREAYAPYDIEVVTDPPADGTDHVEVMIAGRPGDVGLASNILGIAPLAVDCSTQTDVLAFAFSNIHPGGDLLDICATAAHEAGHTFGLDHAFECKDPMTYLPACGSKQFINLELPCGEFDGARDCRCGPTQDSYKKLVSELGPGTLPGPPVVTIQAPAAGSQIPDGVTIFVDTDEPRVVIRVELWINGWRWTDVTGTPSQTLFTIALPSGVPDGVIDLEARAVNDVGVVGTTSVRVTKGAACTSAATCAVGQECDGEGRCVYPPRPGTLGDECATDLDCDTTRCLSDGANHVCTSLCMTDFADACPDGFTCIETESKTTGACWPDDLLPSSGGCCDAGGGAPPAGPALLVLGVWVFARRRRANGT
jgi:uncharacterized protein (TIGR03382 family)